MAVDPISQILDPILPNLNTLIQIGVIILILIVGFIAFLLLITKYKRPIKFKSTIFEKIGESYRIKHENIIFKRTVAELGYYVEKRKIELDIKQGYLMKNGKTHFFLLKIEDRYIPINLRSKMQIKKYEGAESESIDIAALLASSKFDEYEKALTESIKHDARKFKWVDKLGPILMIGLPIIALIIMFFIAAWITRSNAEIVTGLQKLEVPFNQINSNWARVAKSFEIIANELGGPALAPPG